VNDYSGYCRQCVMAHPKYNWPSGDSSQQGYKEGTNRNKCIHFPFQWYGNQPADFSSLVGGLHWRWGTDENRVSTNYRSPGQDGMAMIQQCQWYVFSMGHKAISVTLQLDKTDCCRVGGARRCFYISDYTGYDTGKWNLKKKISFIWYNGVPGGYRDDVYKGGPY